MGPEVQRHESHPTSVTRSEGTLDESLSLSGPSHPQKKKKKIGLDVCKPPSSPKRMWSYDSILQMHAFLICDINPHRKTKSVINYEKIGCHDQLHFPRVLNWINSTPVRCLPLQGDRRFKAVSGANPAVSPYNCIDRISAQFRWQAGCTLTGSVKEPWRLL